MKVWIAFTGAYSDRGVRGVYSDKAAAVAVTMPEAIEWRRTLEARDPVNAARWPPVSEDDCDIECHELTAPDSLDAAWAEAEAARPKGWQLIGLEFVGDGVTDYLGEPTPAPGEVWRASADALGLPEGDPGEDETCIARGSSPIAALRALEAELRERSVL